MICTDATATSSSSILSNRILAVRRSELTSSEKLVARCLLDFIGNNATGWPSIRRMTTESSLSESTVRRALRSLELKGYVKIEPRTRRDGSSTSNLYHWNDKLDPAGVNLSGCQAETRPRQVETPLHEDIRETPTKEHVKPCGLSSGGTKDRKADPDSKSARTCTKRFVKFEDDAKDFKSYESCQAACEATIEAGFLKNCEADRILFFTAYAAICRKLKAKKVSHPARLLRFLIESRKMLIEYGTQADENAARKAIRELRQQA